MSNPLINHLLTSEGMYDAFKLSDTALEWFALGQPQECRSERIASIQSASNTAMTLISAVGTVKQLADTASAGYELAQARCSTDPANQREIQVTKATAKFARSVLDSTAMVADTASNFHQAHWIDLGPAAKAVSGIFYGADIVGNSLDIHHDISKIQACSAKREGGCTSIEKKNRLFDKIVISHLNIIKNACCIIGSVLGFGSLLLGGSASLSIAGLLLSSTWILSKIGIVFYKSFFAKGN